MIKKKQENIPTDEEIAKLESLDTVAAVYIHSESCLPNGNKKTDFIYRSSILPLEITVGNIIRSIKIAYSSTETDNEQLLHLLFGKIKKG